MLANKPEFLQYIFITQHLHIYSLYWHLLTLSVNTFQPVTYCCTDRNECILLTVITVYCRRAAEFYWYSAVWCVYWLWLFLFVPLPIFLLFTHQYIFFQFPTVQLLLSHCSLCTSPLNKPDHTFGLPSAVCRSTQFATYITERLWAGLLSVSCAEGHN